MAKKIDFDINKIPWEGIARVITPILAPLVIAAVWVFFTKTDKKAAYLANLFAVSELIPTVDLNLPPGVVLGSFFTTAEDILESGMTAELKDAWGKTSSLVEDFIKKEGIYEQKTISDDVDKVTAAFGSFVNWLGKKVEESEVEFGGKGLA